MIANQILEQLQTYNDGLSVDHLHSAIEGSNVEEIERELERLRGKCRVFQAENGWWYLDSTIDRSPEELPTERVKPTLKPQSFREKLMTWLEHRTLQDAPVTLKQLSEMWGSTPRTASKTVLDMIKRLPADKAELLDKSVFRNEHKNWRKMQEMQAAEKKKDTDFVVFEVDKPILPKEPEAEKKEFKFMNHTVPPTISTVGGADWIAEVRNCIKKNVSGLPEWRKGLEWYETLIEIERLFGEMGVDENHRSRANLREMAEWLNRQS